MLAFVRVPARTSRRGARYRDSFVPRPTPEFAAALTARSTPWKAAVRRPVPAPLFVTPVQELGGPQEGTPGAFREADVAGERAADRPTARHAIHAPFRPRTRQNRVTPRPRYRDSFVLATADSGIRRRYHRSVYPMESCCAASCSWRRSP